jgi:hypothetical protein
LAAKAAHRGAAPPLSLASSLRSSICPWRRAFFGNAAKVEQLAPHRSALVWLGTSAGFHASAYKGADVLRQHFCSGGFSCGVNFVRVGVLAMVRLTRRPGDDGGEQI